LLDHVEKREAVFRFFPTTGSETTGGDREGAEVRSIEVAVQRVSERRIGHEYEVEVLAFLIQSGGRFGPLD
jgi:hypothetical protein